MSLTVDQVAVACHASPVNVALNWPLILAALEEFGIRSPMVEVAAAATVAVETGTFAPIRERVANPSKQPELYAAQMKYYPWIGRGFVQLTWENNYRLYSNLCKVDLISTPELACDPATAARLLAAFFKHNGIDRVAELRDWRKVRKLVNGGYNGWDRFDQYVRGLLDALGE